MDQKYTRNPPYYTFDSTYIHITCLRHVTSLIHGTFMIFVTCMKAHSNLIMVIMKLKTDFQHSLYHITYKELLASRELGLEKFLKSFNTLSNERKSMAVKIQKI